MTAAKTPRTPPIAAAWGTDRTINRRRVCVERVRPAVDAGRFPVKRVTGDTVVVEADIFADGHDVVAGVLLFKHQAHRKWREAPMEPLGNDRWRATFTVETLGSYHYAVEGWTDPLQTWWLDLQKRVAAQSQSAADLEIGARLIDQAAARAHGVDRQRLRRWAERMRTAAAGDAAADLTLGAEDDAVAAVARRHPDRTRATRHAPELRVTVDPPRAACSAWYELFPRSWATKPDRHGTLRDCLERLDYVASMGFDVLYLTPIHPIGVTFRKGRNNTTTPQSHDVGSPWAIGSRAGGHTAIHPDLGTLDDFDALVRGAQAHGIEIALDIAFQCSPDHPWVTAHPSWFRHRPDGTIQYAENPPKKYQDIYPLDFDTDDWQALWQELRGVFLFWADRGVRVFRVDNPHTKPFRFWEWVIAEVKGRHPDAIFLSEAFTRPRVMYQLAKAGFSQSYTYFTWRNTKRELTEYFTELTQTEVAEYFRPNLWPTTPDILHEYLQVGGRSAFVTRLVLAATLGANYGIYGPAFELCEREPMAAGSEEYLHSEKYEIKQRDLESEWTLRPIITRLNRARCDNPALQTDRHLRFHPVDNDMLLCYSKTTPDTSNAIIVVVNLDATHTQSGWVSLDLDALGLRDDQGFQVHDLLSDARYLWHGPRNYVELDPHQVPAHVFRVRRQTRTESDFDYFV